MYMYKLAFKIIFSKHATYTFRRQEDHNCKEIQTKIKLELFFYEKQMSPPLPFDVKSMSH